MNYLKKYIYPCFVNVASLASIIGLVVVFASESNAIIIALSAFCLCLITILIAALYAINKIIIRNHPEEYKKISSFYLFQCDDGVHSIFETYRLIQCKRPILSQLEYKYKWTGSIPPRITSENQTVEQLPPNNIPHKYDSAIIKFNKPLSYNENAVLHIRTENDDADGRAKPYLESKLTSPIEIMQFRVLLAYKSDTYAEMATVKRKLITSEANTDFEIVCTVPFNQQYKQYYYMIAHPDTGYIYRIEWQK